MFESSFQLTRMHSRLLSDLGIDIGPKGDFGITPVHIAAAAGHAGVIRYRAVGSIFYVCALITSSIP
jgi:hypothetical protein